MRWFPKSRRTRSTFTAVAALLVLGGVVGSVALNEKRPDTAATGRAVESGAGTGGAFTDAADVADDAAVAPTAAGSVAAGGGGALSVSGVGPELATQALPPLDAGRVVKTATLQVEVGEKQFEAAQDRALREITEAGGFVQTSNLTPARASLTFRVPADRFETVLRHLHDLGEVKDEAVSGQDVTEEYVDLEARLRHWKAQEAVFLDLLGRARNVAETVEIRRELSTIQQTVEQLQGRIRYLDDRTGFSTVTLEMFVPGAPLTRAEPEGPSLSEAWSTAWDAAVNVVGGTLIVLGALVPLTAMGGLVALVVWLALRRRRPGEAAPAAPA